MSMQLCSLFYDVVNVHNLPGPYARVYPAVDVAHDFPCQGWGLSCAVASEAL